MSMMLPEALSAYLETHATEVLDLAMALCRQPSVAAQGLGIEEAAALVAGMLEETGFATRLLRVPEAPPVVYGERRGRGPFTLLLYNHYDVQPPEPLALWDSPPFEPTVREGRLYGRGAADNKGEIAARLAALRALLAVEGDLPFTVRWILEGEEEIGSPHFEAVARRYAPLLRADACLWEGAGFSPSGRPELCLGVKGLLYVQLDVTRLRRDAHSGLASTLPSAAWHLLGALHALRGPDGRVRIPGFADAVRPPTEAQRAAVRDMPDTEDVYRETYGIDQFVGDQTGVSLRTQACFSPTANIAGLWSGYTGEGVKTVLPASASAKLDFRLVPDQDPHDIAEKLRAHLRAEGYGDVSVSVLGSAAPVVTPMDAPIVRRVAAIAEAYWGERPILRPISAGSLPLLDALRRHVGVPGLFAPGNPGYWDSAAHAPNEHIRLEHLREALRFNAAMFRALGEDSGDG